jgi:hypothetical protein
MESSLIAEITEELVSSDLGEKMTLTLRDDSKITLAGLRDTIVIKTKTGFGDISEESYEVIKFPLSKIEEIEEASPVETIEYAGLVWTTRDYELHGDGFGTYRVEL